jgi:hypothetical protein
LTGVGTITTYTVKRESGQLLIAIERGEKRVENVSVSINLHLPEGSADKKMIREVLLAAMFSPDSPFANALRTRAGIFALACEWKFRRTGEVRADSGHASCCRC